MYHLRLIKGLSYTGIVSATRAKPDVFTTDEAVCKAAVDSGYFELVSITLEDTPDSTDEPTDESTDEPTDESTDEPTDEPTPKRGGKSAKNKQGE